jgi:hypothetical protein
MTTGLVQEHREAVSQYGISAHQKRGSNWNRSQFDLWKGTHITAAQALILSRGALRLHLRSVSQFSQRTPGSISEIDLRR